MNDHLQSFQNEMRKFTDAISCYGGNDPLDLWFRFICWLEQNSGNDVENLFKTNLEKCLSIFEKYDNYKQDLRMVKLWIKYIDFLPNPLELYQILYQRQVGTQCAAFYIGWAHYYNASNAFKQAESIYNLGLQLKAQPLEELEAAQQKFRYSVAQRMLYDDSSSKKRTISSLAEQRQQITSLSPHQHQQHQQPNKRGRYEYEYSQSQSKYHDQTINNTNVDGYNQYNMNSHNSHQYNNKSSPQNHQTQMQKLQTEESAQQQDQMQSQTYYENANSNDAGYVISSSLNYLYDNTTPITYNMENSQSNQQVSTVTVQETQERQPPFSYEDGIQLPAHFICSAKNNTDQWLGSLCLEEPYDQNRKCFYPKHIVYPGDGFEYSLEEIRARKHYARIEEEREKARRIQEQEELERQRQFADIEQQKQAAQSRHRQQQQLQEQENQNYFRQYPENHHSLYQQQYGAEYEVYYYENQQQSVIVSAKHFQEQQYDNQPEYSQYQEPQYQQNQLQTTEMPIQEQQPQQQQQQNQYEEQNNVMEKTIPDFVAPVNIIPIEHETAKDQKNEELVESDYESEEYEEVEEEEENEETDDEDSESSENYTQPQVEIQSKHEVKSTSDDLEEQIEASTISFCSTTTSGISTQKKITIKFRKEKSTPVYPTSENNSGSSSPTIEDSFGKPLSTSKARKRKTTKFISAYVNENTTFMPSNNNSCSERPSESSNAVDDAELLLSFSNIHKNRHIESNESTTNSELNNSFGNISFAAISQKSSANHNFSTSTCSTPIRHSSISRTPLTTPISSYKFLKKHESNLSLQNDDSIISYTADQNSFFQAENDEELQKRRLDRAIQTIESHYSKRDVDPFNSELCKAFLVKLNFPNRENTADYKIINQNLPKLSKNQVVPLGGYSYQIEKEVGRGSYGAVYRSVKTDDGSIVALKYQKPPNLWELYICTEVKNRLKHSDILPGFMSISAALIAPNASVLISEFSQYGSLLDVNNKIRQSTTKVMHESLVMHFSSQILNIVDYLHSINIIHADIKPDNFLLMTIPNPDSNVPSLRLIDFGCAIDMNLFEKGTEFRKIVQTDGFTCTEMLEGRPWTYQTDLFCVAGTIHVMLFGEYMQVVKKFEMWEIKQKFPRYLKKHVWSEIIEKLLNIKDKDNLPNLQEMRKIINRELMGMENELNKQIRSLSNIMKRR